MAWGVSNSNWNICVQRTNGFCMGLLLYGRGKEGGERGERGSEGEANRWRRNRRVNPYQVMSILFSVWDRRNPVDPASEQAQYSQNRHISTDTAGRARPSTNHIRNCGGSICQKRQTGRCVVWEKPVRIDPKCHICFSIMIADSIYPRGGRERENWEEDEFVMATAHPPKQKKRAKMKNRRRDRRCEITPPWHLANKRSFECVCNQPDQQTQPYSQTYLEEGVTASM